MQQIKNGSVNIIEYEGQKVYYLNHRCLTGNDLLDDIEDCEKALYGLKDILVLEDYRDTQIIDSLDRFYDEASVIYRSEWKKVAIIGEKTLLPVFSDLSKLSICINAEAFTDKEAALDYLVS